MPRTPRSLSGRLQQQLPKLRRRRGLSQERVAEGIGISLRYYQRLETEARINPSLATLEALRQFLEIEPYELFYEREELERKFKRPAGVVN